MKYLGIDESKVIQHPAMEERIKECKSESNPEDRIQLCHRKEFCSFT